MSRMELLTQRKQFEVKKKWDCVYSPISFKMSLLAAISASLPFR
jgi:hypothetical protein